MQNQPRVCTRAGEINSFERFHLRSVASRFASVIAWYRVVIKNHGRGVNFREMEIHGKFNPVIRPASVPFDTRRGYRNLAITNADREMERKLNSFIHVYYISGNS